MSVEVELTTQIIAINDTRTEITVQAPGPAGAQGPTGPAGATGSAGPAGSAATIAVGSVTQGTAVAVTNSGSSSAAVFDFVLVKGDKGDKGDTGDTGATGATGAAGSAATITVGTVTTGTAASQTLAHLAPQSLTSRFRAATKARLVRLAPLEQLVQQALACRLAELLGKCSPRLTRPTTTRSGLIRLAAVALQP
jgi:hypothetical protein